MIVAYVTVDVDIEDIDTQDLIDELQDRGYTIYDCNPFENDDDFVTLYEKRVRGEDITPLIDKLLYKITGRIVP